jgi:hypothetical protein
MRSPKRMSVGWVLATTVLIITGCGQAAISNTKSTGGLTPNAIGACRNGGQTDSGAFDVTFQSGRSGWVIAGKLPASGPSTSMAGPLGKVSGQVVSIGADSHWLRPGVNQQAGPSDLAISSDTLATLNEALGAGDRVLVETDPLSGTPPASLGAAIEYPDGSVAFVGDCAYDTLTVPFAHLSDLAQKAGESGTPSSMLEALISAPGGPMTKAFEDLMKGPSTAWSDIAPNRRSVNPQVTPTSVLADLTQVTIAVAIPDSWLKWPDELCTRSDQGWNDCVAFTAVTSGQPAVLNAYVRPGTSLDVVILAGQTFDSPSAVLYQVPPGQLHPGAVVQLSGSPSIVAASQLLDGSVVALGPTK